MTTALVPETAAAAVPVDHQLLIERQDIVFFNVAPNRLRISVNVTNSSLFPSRCTRLAIEAAPFGAFVRGTPLAELSVPALSAGEQTTAETEIMYRRARPLGDFTRVPPRRLLTAFGADDERDADETGTNRRFLTEMRRRIGGPEAGVLPADPFDLLSRSNVHWAGNLNVFIGGKAVERHLARALRVYAGRTNLAMFLVGQRKDAYAFELEGECSGWENALYKVEAQGSFTRLKGESLVREGEWVNLSGMAPMMLATVPPAGCTGGQLDVHVTQRSTGHSTVVEFSLDPAAQGCGCYTV